MINKKFLVIDNMGIHARPASSIVKIASKFQSDCKIKINNKDASLKSIISLMSLAIKKNDIFSIEIDGKDEIEALNEIVKIIIDSKIAKEV